MVLYNPHSDPLSNAVSHITTGSERAGGAYGFRLLGQQHGLDALPRAPASWPVVTLRWEAGRIPEGGREIEVDEREARVRVPGVAGVLLDRDASSATLVSPEPLGDDRFLHPMLGYIASVFSHWLGRLVLHGGAFAAGDEGVALLGGRGAGKSSTLAWLAREGAAVVADDVLVLDGLSVFAGPRSIDLWPETARHLGFSEHTDTVRGGHRQRLEMRPAANELQLRAWVSLAWGPRTALRPLRPQERYSKLVEQLHVHEPGRLPGPEKLLELLALPALELTRPKQLDSLPGAGAALLELTRRLARESS